MKKIKTFLILAALCCSSFLFAQDPPPPPPGSHGQTNNQPGGGAAPIGSGIAILLALGAGYGVKKVYDARGTSLRSAGQ